MGKKIVGIIGSYRKGRIIDTAVSTILKGAEDHGAKTEKIYLLDKHIEFCTNCRKCTQENADITRGKCIQKDDMEQILTEIDDADGIVLGSPINFFNVTAVTKRFIERLLVFSYWPWGRRIPKYRINKLHKKAVIVTSSGCPAWLGRIFFRGALYVLKAATRCMGAKVVKSFYFGDVCLKQDQQLAKKDLSAAYKAGERLAT
jgi:NAD(P)H-dependent FMN reductase